MFENSMTWITSYPKLSKKLCLGAHLRSFWTKEKEFSGSSKRQICWFVYKWLHWRDGCMLRWCNFYTNFKSFVTKGAFPQLCRYHHSSRVFRDIFRDSRWLSSLGLSQFSSPSHPRFSMASSPPLLTPWQPSLDWGEEGETRAETDAAVSGCVPYGVRVSSPGRELGFTRAEMSQDVTPGSGHPTSWHRVTRCNVRHHTDLWHKLSQMRMLHGQMIVDEWGK